MSFRAVVAIYNLILPLAMVLAAPGYFLKMVRRGGFLRDFGQRFGFYSRAAKRSLFSDPPIWIHAVSVGEVLLAHKLIRALRESAPDLPLVLSCTTSTGYALAKKSADLGYAAIYNPIDLSGPTRRAFQQIKPRLLVLIEAEIWPNLLWHAKRNGVPVLLANARLSPRSEKRFRKFGALTRPMFAQLDRVLAQSERDLLRIEGLGVNREKILSTGSIKFDQQGLPDVTGQVEEFQKLLNRLRNGREGEVVLGGSTHSGEEKHIGSAFLKLKAEHPSAFLVVVPRHAERAAEVVSDLKSISLAPVLKTELEEAIPEISEQTCLVVNTTGELRAWYFLASIVLIGKSFLAEGGQNPVEPLAAGKPVIMGPNMQNFAEFVERMVESGACVQLSDSRELEAALIQLVESEEQRRSLIQNVDEVLGPDQGAATRSATEILRMMKL
ncbi:MAG: 3-deoxy-D-manno-octulosonic acid transferase [Verrucomicrobiota bacterium]